MASPAFVAVSSVVTQPSTGNGAATVNKPTGTQEGDLLILWVITGNSGTASVLSAPAGFTKVAQINCTSFVAGGQYWWKIAGGSEPASYSVTETAATVQGRTCMCAWRGVDQTTPINASAQSGAQNGTTTVSIPSVTTTVAETTLVAIPFEYNARSLTISPAGGLTARQTYATSRSFLIADEAIASAGTVSGRTATTPTNGDFFAMAFAIAPPASDSTAPTLTSPTSASTGSTTGDGTVTTDEANGTLYAVVTTISTPPSGAQVRAGQDATGAAAAWANSQAVSSTGAKTFNATGLTPSTTYYFHFQHRDAASNDSAVSSAASFTTEAATTGNPVVVWM